MAQEKVLQKNLVRAPALCGTEAVERREIKNLPRKIKMCTNVWKFIIFMVESIFTFIIILIVSYCPFSGQVGVAFVFRKGQATVSRTFMDLTIPWNFLICMCDDNCH